MGSSCSNKEPQIDDGESICLQADYSQANFQKYGPYSKRFNKIDRNYDEKTQLTTFKLSSSIQTICIKIPIIAPQIHPKRPTPSSINQQFIYQAKLSRFSPHVTDNFDPNPNQIYFKYEIPSEKSQNSGKQIIIGDGNDKFSVKVYSVKGENDPLFRNGLYEIYLHQTLLHHQKQSQTLKSSFFIENNKIKSLVFIFHSYLCTLFDILQYRNSQNYHYTHDQEIYIAHQLINNYRLLDINNIAHRDIRPSKIYLFDPTQYQPSTESKHQKQQSYEFVNLESSRKITEDEYRNYFQSNKKIPLTPRGVPHYSPSDMKQLFMKKKKVGTYDFQINDSKHLAFTLCALVTLNPLQNQAPISVIRKKNKELASIVEMLIDDELTNIENIFHYSNKLIKNIKVRTINCLKQQKYQFTAYPNGILTSDFDIATGLLNKKMMQYNEEKLRIHEQQAMFSMVQEHLYLPIFQSEIKENYELAQKDSQNAYDYLNRNIPLLHRLGQNYERLGMVNNNYFREEISVILECCRILRSYGQKTEKLLVRANSIYHEKILRKTKAPIIRYLITLENAYSQLSDNRPQDSLNTINQLIIPITGDQIPRIKREPFDHLPIYVQIEALQAKGVILAENQQFQKYELYLEQALRIIIKENKVYARQTSLLQALLVKYTCQEISYRDQTDRSNKTTDKQLIKCEKLLESAVQTLKNNCYDDDIVSLAKIYEIKGDLYIVKQQHQESMKQYKSAYGLLCSAQRSVAQNLKNQIILKASNLLSLHQFEYDQRVWVQKRLYEFKLQKDKSEAVQSSNSSVSSIQLQNKKQSQFSQYQKEPLHHDYLVEREQEQEQLFPMRSPSFLRQSLSSSSNINTSNLKKKRARVSLQY